MRASQLFIDWSLSDSPLTDRCLRYLCCLLSSYYYFHSPVSCWKDCLYTTIKAPLSTPWHLGAQHRLGLRLDELVSSNLLAFFLLLYVWTVTSVTLRDLIDIDLDCGSKCNIRPDNLLNFKGILTNNFISVQKIEFYSCRILYLKNRLIEFF